MHHRSHVLTPVYTGFDLAPRRRGAVAVDWIVQIVDDFGVSNRDWHTTEASVHSWHKGKGFTASGSTNVFGEVIEFVILWVGTICYFDGPTDAARL